MTLAWLAAGVLLLAGCSQTAAPAAAPVRVQLTEAADWSPAQPDADPFQAFAEGRVRCSTAAIRAEGTWIEVNTTTCNYSTLIAHFASAAPAGSRVSGELAWATLAAIDPAVATLAIALGERVLWSRDVTIPGEADLVTVEFELPLAVEAGRALFFHVRNHGYNSWQLGPLTLQSG